MCCATITSWPNTKSWSHLVCSHFLTETFALCLKLSGFVEQILNAIADLRWSFWKWTWDFMFLTFKGRQLNASTKTLRQSINRSNHDKHNLAPTQIVAPTWYLWSEEQNNEQIVEMLQQFKSFLPWCFPSVVPRQLHHSFSRQHNLSHRLWGRFCPTGYGTSCVPQVMLFLTQAFSCHYSEQFTSRLNCVWVWTTIFTCSFAEPLQFSTLMSLAGVALAVFILLICICVYAARTEKCCFARECNYCTLT